MISKFHPINREKSPLKTLTITLSVLITIVSMDLLILPINFKVISLDITNIALLSFLGAFVSFFAELVIGLLLKKRNDRIDLKSPNIYYTSQLSLKPAKLSFHFIIISISILEEIIFRGTILQYLLSLGIPLLLSLGITSISYGVNHFFRGPTTVIQKSTAGFIFGLVMYQSNFFLFAPVIAHIGENFLILIYERIKHQDGTKRS